MGPTTVDYYQYQRDQSFKKYMEISVARACQDLPIPILIIHLIRKRQMIFLNYLKRHIQGNKVVETEKQKKAIIAQMEMDKIDAKI